MLHIQAHHSGGLIFVSKLLAHTQIKVGHRFASVICWTHAKTKVGRRFASVNCWPVRALKWGTDLRP
eukprot:6738338-Pyramimonas_sp.AAC.1